MKVLHYYNRINGECFTQIVSDNLFYSDSWLILAIGLNCLQLPFNFCLQLPCFPGRMFVSTISFKSFLHQTWPYLLQTCYVICKQLMLAVNIKLPNISALFRHKHIMFEVTKRWLPQSYYDCDNHNMVNLNMSREIISLSVQLVFCIDRDLKIRYTVRRNHL